MVVKSPLRVKAVICEGWLAGTCLWVCGVYLRRWGFGGLGCFDGSVWGLKWVWEGVTECNGLTYVSGM